MYKKAYELIEQGLALNEVSKEIGKSYNATKKGVRRYALKNNLPTVQDLVQVRPPKKKPLEEFTEQRADGTIIKQTIINKPLKGKDNILKAHGFDDSMELVHYRESVWDGFDGEEKFASRITVKPRTDKQTQEDLLRNILSVVSEYKPNLIPKVEKKEVSNKHLVLPLFDLHYSNNDREFYRSFLERLMERNTYRTATIILGGDALEHDNFIFTTESGTRTEDRELTEDYTGLYEVLTDIISHTKKNANQVKFIYIRGNHSPSMDWALSHALERANKDVLFDLSLDTLKATRVGDSFIGLQHGHIKASQRDTQSLAYLYRDDFSKCKYHYVLSGHYHTDKEFLKDSATFYHIQFPSPERANGWAKDNHFHSQFNGLRYLVFEDGEGMTENYWHRRK